MPTMYVVQVALDILQEMQNTKDSALDATLKAYDLLFDRMYADDMMFVDMHVMWTDMSKIFRKG